MNAVGINIAAFMTDRQQEYELSGFQPNSRYFGQRLCSPTTQRSVQQIEPNFVDVEAKHRSLYRYDFNTTTYVGISVQAPCRSLKVSDLRLVTLCILMYV